LFKYCIVSEFEALDLLWYVAAERFVGICKDREFKVLHNWKTEQRTLQNLCSLTQNFHTR